MPDNKTRARLFVARWLDTGGGSQELCDMVEKLYVELEFAVEEYESALPYVPDYFREKWGYDVSLERMKKALEAT